MIADVDLSKPIETLAEALHGTLCRFILEEVLNRQKSYSQKDGTTALFKLQADRLRSFADGSRRDQHIDTFVNEEAISIIKLMVETYLEKK